MMTTIDALVGLGNGAVGAGAARAGYAAPGGNGGHLAHGVEVSDPMRRFGRSGSIVQLMELCSDDDCPLAGHIRFDSLRAIVQYDLVAYSDAWDLLRDEAAADLGQGREVPASDLYHGLVMSDGNIRFADYANQSDDPNDDWTDDDYVIDKVPCYAPVLAHVARSDARTLGYGACFPYGPSLRGDEYASVERIRTILDGGGRRGFLDDLDVEFQARLVTEQMLAITALALGCCSGVDLPSIREDIRRAMSLYWGDVDTMRHLRIAQSLRGQYLRSSNHRGKAHGKGQGTTARVTHDPLPPYPLMGGEATLIPAAGYRSITDLMMGGSTTGDGTTTTTPTPSSDAHHGEVIHWLVSGPIA